MGLLILPASTLILLLAGYPVAARLLREEPGQRVALGLLAGLLVELFMVAAVGLLRPFSGAAAWLCVSPILVTAAHPSTRRQLIADLRALLPTQPAAILTGCSVLFLAILLWPLLGKDGLVHFEGTANHDSFFWITGAEHLTRHTYLEMPASDATHPLLLNVKAIVGFSPDWGRMGAEGLLAVTSSLSGLPPVSAYLYFTAALFFPWMAAVYLVARIFVRDRITGLALIGLALFQPLFAFYYMNGNLPNLVGIVAGAGLVVAIERCLQSEPPAPTAPWLVLIALGFHGVLCSYPEILPLLLLPAGLLCVRHLAKRTSTSPRRAFLHVSLATLAGLLINPVTTWRAIHGFISVSAAVLFESIGGNIFHSTPASEFLPTLVTLSTKTGHVLGTAGGWIVTLLLVAVLFATIHRARDRTGTLILCSGAVALGLFTAFTGFSYGWQKTVQSSAVFLAAILPVGALQLLAAGPAPATAGRLPAKLAALGTAGFFVFALVIVHLDIEKWSERKGLSPDWFALREIAPAHPAVLVDAASFPQPFFHGMWSAYFLRDSAVYYTARSGPEVGYFRQHVSWESHAPNQKFSAVLVSREWADEFDRISPRLFVGRDFVLLERKDGAP